MRVVAVIPAYNEEKTLGAVVEAVRESGMVDRILVISDGSTDTTAEVARKAGAECIELEQNVGKGGALKEGIDRADSDVFLFLDADLIGLKPHHVKALLAPVLEGRADMSLGVLRHGRPVTDLAQAVAPYLSGQRAVKREVLLDVSGLEMARFGVEVALTRHIREKGVKVEEVILEGVSHRMKEEKYGLLRGFLLRMKMYWEIVKASSAIRD
ncbi:MAG: glycosyltransferase family 2 protein [Clostridiales bacterium]|nr:glycosyltransferase family 2 protein [Clostridiales bacterium]